MPKNFIGMIPDEALKIIQTNYPSVSCSIRTYITPKYKLDRNSNVTFRIVRQKQTGDNQLEFIISPFIHNE